MHIVPGVGPQSGLVSLPEGLHWVRPDVLIYGDDTVINRIVIGGKTRTIAGGAAFSVDADGGRIAESTENDCPTCSGPAHVSTIDGRIVGTIHYLQGSDNAPSLSPDGKRIAFEYGNGVWVAAADGSGKHEVATVGNHVFSPYPTIPPVWSPDGKELAYTETDRPSGDATSWVVGADGGSPRRVGHGFVDGGWSPNGKLIALVDQDRWVVVDVATGKERRLAAVGTPGPWSPETWSRDSRGVLVESDGKASGVGTFWLVPSDGGDARLVLRFE
jgi:hypothetical protein